MQPTKFKSILIFLSYDNREHLMLISDNIIFELWHRTNMILFDLECTVKRVFWSHFWKKTFFELFNVYIVFLFFVMNTIIVIAQVALVLR